MSVLRDSDNLFTDNLSTCSNGIITGGKCSSDDKYKIPGGGTAAFYTTWSFFFCIVGVTLAMIIFIPFNVFMMIKNKTAVTSEPSKYFKLFESFCSYVVVPLIAASAINSLGVLITSQIFFADNLDNSISIASPSPPNDKAEKKLPGDISITTNFVKRMNQINLKVHIIPGVLAALVLLVLSCGHVNCGDKWWIISIMTAAIMMAFLISYLCVPNPFKWGGLIGIQKVNNVYNNPQPWMFLPQAAISALLIVFVPLLVLKRSEE